MLRIMAVKTHAVSNLGWVTRSRFIGRPMSFDYYDWPRVVIDRQRKISIRDTNKGDDAYPYFQFLYESPKLSFKFGGYYRSDRCTFILRGKPKTEMLPVGFDIVEPSMKRGLEAARAELSPEEYKNLKEILREGMAAYGMPRYSDHSPILSEFIVNFVAEAPAASASSKNASRALLGAMLTQPARWRKWTDAEVEEAIAEIKREPGLWEELERIEKTTAGFNTEVGKREWDILIKLHPECPLREINDLYCPVRSYRRAQLGLE
jgi:hypothetical protein